MVASVFGKGLLGLGLDGEVVSGGGELVGGSEPGVFALGGAQDAFRAGAGEAVAFGEFLLAHGVRVCVVNVRDEDLGARADGLERADGD